MKRAVVHLAVALASMGLAACDKTVVDGCAGQTGTCISLVVRAGAGPLGNIDQIGVRPTMGFSFATGELRSPATPSGKPIELPAVVPILPDASFTGGDFSLSVDSFAAGAVTGAGTTSGTVALGKHVVVEVTLEGGPDVDLSAIEPPDAGTDGMTTLPTGAPRPIAPSSGAYLTTHKPTLSWELPSGADGARIDLCAKRDCTSILKTYDAPGTSLTLPDALPRQIVYWRLHPMAGGQVVGQDVSVTWAMVATALNTSRDSFYGALPDLNGDGFADVVGGANQAPVLVSMDEGTAGPGRAHVYLGKATAKSWITTAPTTGDFNIDDPDAMDGDEFGATFFVADLDGDGYADLAVGAPCATKAGTLCGAGRVHLFRGGPNGLSAPSPAADASLSAPTGANLFGISLAAADLDRDGYIDLVVGASGSDQVFVYRGGPSLFAAGAAPAWTLTGPSGFGTSISASGDLDGDGVPDLLVGSPQGSNAIGTITQFLGGVANAWTSGAKPAGKPLAFSVDLTGCNLGASVAIAGDLDGDGIGDAVVGAPADCTAATGGIVLLVHGVLATGLDGTTATLLSHDPSGSEFGEFLMSGGDVNGDGKTEAILSGPGYTADPSMPGTIDAGHAIVLYGGNTNFVGNASIELADGSKAAGYAQGLHFGGDIDGDGFDDLVIGSPMTNQSIPPFNSTGYQQGKLDIFFGSAAGLTPSMPATLYGPDSEGGEFGD